MIRFNPYDVSYILFIKKEKFREFQLATASSRSGLISVDPVSYHIFSDAFKEPGIDPEKIHDYSKLTEAIFVQEVRMQVLVNDWLEKNVFRKENDHIITDAFRFKYKYLNGFTAERRNLKPSVLSNKMCLLMDKNNEILFAGLIDITENTIASADKEMELKLYSLAYLLTVVSDVEVCLFDKQKVYEYNKDGQFGLVGFQWPVSGDWEPHAISGEQLRHPSNIINLYILEALRYYFGDDPNLMNMNGYGPTFYDYVNFRMTGKSGVLTLRSNVVDRYILWDDNRYELSGGDCFVHGNYFYFAYCYSRLVTVGEVTYRAESYWYYRMPTNDDFEIQGSDLEFYKYFTCDSIRNDFIANFKLNMGFDYPSVADQWPTWQEGAYRCSIELVSVPTIDIKLIYFLPVQLDFDICTGGTDSKGVMLKLGDLVQAACAAELCYIDVGKSGCGFSCERKKVFSITEANQELWYDDQITIISKRRMVLNRDKFDCFDILNQNSDMTLMYNKIMYDLYNRKLYNAALEELQIVSPDLLQPDRVINFKNHGKFIVAETQPIYDQNGFKYSKAKIWRLTYA